jgi:hypothetical protein
MVPWPWALAGHVMDGRPCFWCLNSLPLAAPLPHWFTILSVLQRLLYTTIRLSYMLHTFTFISHLTYIKLHITNGSGLYKVGVHWVSCTISLASDQQTQGKRTFFFLKQIGHTISMTLSSWWIVLKIVWNSDPYYACQTHLRNSSLLIISLPDSASQTLVILPHGSLKLKTHFYSDSQFLLANHVYFSACDFLIKNNYILPRLSISTCQASLPPCSWS